MSGEIIPRWEWRTFGDNFGDAEAVFAAMEPEKVQESDEIYLLSTESDASIKVRDGVMDVKTLEQVNADGLQQWKPIMKATWPLAAEDVLKVLAVAGVDAPVLKRETYTLDQFEEELVDSETLDLEHVGKRREHYTLGGCMAEISVIDSRDGIRRTMAVESEDPAAVIAAVRSVGLADRRNVCMARGLKALADFGKRYGVIDVGTNSVKFYVGDRAPDGEWFTVTDRAEVTRLGEGIDETGGLVEAAMERTVAAIVGMAHEALGEYEVRELVAVGTAGLRMASNSAEFLTRVRERAGVEVEIISGEEENRLAYLAVKAGVGLAEGSLVVFDTGGGSSQFTFGAGDRIDEQFSVNVGAVRFTERFGLDEAVTEDELAAAQEAIAADLEKLDGRPPAGTIVGMGGTVTNLTAISLGLATYDPDRVQGATLDRAEIERQIEVFRTRSADERREIVGIQPKRAEVILAGASIVKTILDKFGHDSFTVSDRSLRHGLVLDRFSG